MPTPNQSDESRYGPAVGWLALGLLLAGLGTVLLGPILPTIQHRWHLTDQQVGPLFFTKFVGSFLGGLTVPRRLRNGILLGTLCAAAGFAAFGAAPNVHVGAITLFVAGFGLGQIIASTNILAGNRYAHLTGSALASLNFFFSLGMVVTGLLVAVTMPEVGVADMLFLIASALAATGVLGRMKMSGGVTPSMTSQQQVERLPRQVILLFAVFLFFYGGLETGLAGWMTTFTQRYSHTQFIGGQSAVVLLMASLACGRLLSTVAMRYVSEIVVQRVGLVLSALSIVGLSTSKGTLDISAWSIAIGISLAPFFPATFALLMRRKPTAREAGFVLAVSGLGAAVFPWLMGFVSTQSGSLRMAMAVPVFLTLGLLALSFVLKAEQPHAQISSTPSA